MKRQYLGDAKDSFKWDYHDFLTTALACRRLDVVCMLTPDDGSGHGQTDPDRFPGRAEVIGFCADLRRLRSIEAAADLPRITGAEYRLHLHGADRYFDGRDRSAYFRAVARRQVRQVILIDADNGFEPTRSCTVKHVAYDDVRGLLDAVHPETVISVFQHHRRRRFPEDFAQIRDRLGPVPAVAVYWQMLMFVAVSRSAHAIAAVANANTDYARMRPVRALGRPAFADTSPRPPSSPRPHSAADTV